jgi:hypothetical protein
MNMLIWNVRGLNHPSKQKEVLSIVRTKQISIVCLVENKVKESHAVQICSSMLPNWDCQFNYGKHYLGRIWVCWKKEEFIVSVVDRSDQSVTCIFYSNQEKACWYQTFVYGANNPIDRRCLWQNFHSMKLRVSSTPWILCGDFNVVRCLEEKWVSAYLTSYKLEFGDCLNNIEVMDLNFSGCFYSWNNKSAGPGFVANKLDRVLVNEEWIYRFGRTCVDFPSNGISGHSPAIIYVGTMVSFGPKPFKFFTYWLENKEYMDWLTTSWNQEYRGVPMYKLCMKLKAFKAISKGKNSSCYGDITSKVIQARECLEIT